jgi:hypothetical protein
MIAKEKGLLKSVQAQDEVFAMCSKVGKLGTRFFRKLKTNNLATCSTQLDDKHGKIRSSFEKHLKTRIALISHISSSNPSIDSPAPTAPVR